MKHICPVCGFPGLDELAYDENKNGSYEICPSCGFEFGVTDDDQGFSIQDWRKQWIEKGMKWWSEDTEYNPQPQNWDPKEQLKNIPKEFK